MRPSTLTLPPNDLHLVHRDVRCVALPCVEICAATVPQDGTVTTAFAAEHGATSKEPSLTTPSPPKMGPRWLAKWPPGHGVGVVARAAPRVSMTSPRTIAVAPRLSHMTPGNRRGTRGLSTKTNSDRAA